MIRPSTSWLCFYLTDNLNTSIVETRTAASGRSAPNINEVQNRIKEILNKYRNGIWVSKMSQIYQEMYWDELSTAVLSQLEHWPHICTVSIECHFCGRCQYPSDFTAHLPNVILGSLAFSFNICSCCFFLFFFFKCLWNNIQKVIPYWSGIVLEKKGQPLWPPGTSARCCWVSTFDTSYNTDNPNNS